MSQQADFENVMNRIKNLTEYEVQVTVPDEFEFDGPVPFDMSIAGDTAWVKVVATSIEEATMKANEYFECKYK